MQPQARRERGLNVQAGAAHHSPEQRSVVFIAVAQAAAHDGLRQRVFVTARRQ